jgi:hypothetical protein
MSARTEKARDLNYLIFIHLMVFQLRAVYSITKKMTVTEELESMLKEAIMPYLMLLGCFVWSG